MRFMHNRADVDSRVMVRAVPRMGCVRGRLTACALAIGVAVGGSFWSASLAWSGGGDAGTQAAQAPPRPPAKAKPAAPSQPPPQPAGVTPPNDYVIGPEDVLAIVFWREKDLSADVVVRPDGMITLPLVNDIKAAGLTTEQLRQAVMEAAGRYVEDPNATVVVKQINSRRVFITGEVGRAGPYPLGSSMTVLQALALAGGPGDYAKKDRILILRPEGGKTRTLKFNYKEVIKGEKLEQNIELKPGDTIIVP